MKYYTIEEAAALLPYRTPDGKPDVEFTFDLTTGKSQRDGNSANILWPSAVFESHVKVQRVNTTGKRVVESHLADYGGGQEHFAEEEVLIGCFGVAGERGGLLTWHKGVAKVYRIDDASIKGNDGYRTIKKDQIRISADDLHSFLDQENIPVPPEVQKEVPGGTTYSRDAHDWSSCHQGKSTQPLTLDENTSEASVGIRQGGDFDTTLTKEKYCVPHVTLEKAWVRLSSTSGHTVIIGEIPRSIMVGFEQQAIKEGCITEQEYLRQKTGDSILHPPADPPEWLQRLPEVFTLEDAVKVIQTKQESRIQTEHEAVESLLVKLYRNDPVASYRFGKSVSVTRSAGDEEKPFQCKEVVHFLFHGNVRGRMVKQDLKGKIEILPRRGPHSYFDCKVQLYILDMESPNGITFISPCERVVIDEDSLVVTREFLWKHAVASGDLGVKERLEALAGEHSRVENHDEQETCEGLLENIGVLSQREQAEKRKEFIGKCKESGKDIYYIGARLKKSGASASFIRRELDPEYKQGENKSTTATQGGVFVKKCLEYFETNNK